MNFIDDKLTRGLIFTIYSNNEKNNNYNKRYSIILF